MFTFEFTLNILIVAAMLAVSVFAGFTLRSRQLAKSRFRIIELEKEMLGNYAEILELQKEYISMEMKLRELQIPVIPIKAVINNEGGHESFADVSRRKKLLIKESMMQQSVASK